MSILAMWYYTSREGQQFLAARDFRVAVAAVGVLVAYILLRTRRRQHPGSWWWAVGRGGDSRHGTLVRYRLGAG